jgi:hypothetical protein
MTASFPSPLQAIMDVFDRADALDTLPRDQLLAAVQQIDPQRDPGVLAAAVDAHLAAVQNTPSDIPILPFQFPWARPATETERQARVQGSRRWAWLDDGTTRQLVLSLGSTLLMVLGMIGGAFFHLAGGFWGGMWLGTAVGIGLGLTVEALHQRQRLRWLPFQGDLAYDMKAYVTCGETRAYLRALLRSGCPQLLGGDADALNALVKRYTQAKTLHGRLEARRREALMAERERAERLAFFAQALEERVP